MKNNWKKAYKGPFKKSDAIKLMSDLRTKKRDNISEIERVAIRKRKRRTNDSVDMYDVFIREKAHV